MEKTFYPNDNKNTALPIKQQQQQQKLVNIT